MKRDYTQELADYLNVKRAATPIDGGVHQTRRITSDEALTFEQLKDFVSAVGMKSVYGVEQIRVTDVETFKEVHMWKVRGIFK